MRAARPPCSRGSRAVHPGQAGFGIRPFGASWVRVPSVCRNLGVPSSSCSDSGAPSVRLQHPGFGFRPSMLEKTMWVRVPSIWRLKTASDGRNTNPTSANGRKPNPHCLHAAPLHAGSPRCMHIKNADNKRSNYAPKSIVRPILLWWRRGESNSGPRQLPDRHLQAQLLI